MTNQDRRRRLGFTLIELLVVIAIIGVLIALLLPAVQMAREAARAAKCKNNLKQIGLALHNYHDIHASFPPGTVRRIANPPGNWATSLLTWMPRILPHLDHKSVFDKIDWEQEPGSQGANADLIAIPMAGFRCPSDPGVGMRENFAPTNYVACVSTERSPWPSASWDDEGVIGKSVMHIDSTTPIHRVKDGTSSTMMVSECLVNSPWVVGLGNMPDYLDCLAGNWPNVEGNEDGSGNFIDIGRGNSWFYGSHNQAWSYNTTLSPNDPQFANHECYRFSDTGVFGARSKHPGGVHVLLVDGATRFVNETIDIELWRALGTPAGREVVGEF